ncbi:sirohydrochlorin chelatase [Methylophaga sp.]|uniref:sirohydrochlorin chelatase n=1 Tax=Methylophaga sp. TaxID=2024840 RepID=UPI003F69D9D1
MKALLIVAHGSRRQASNQEVMDLAELVAQRQDNSFDLVESAFLELAETLIPDGIEQCARAGATQITVMPYFLNSGKHVTQDIPEVITAIKPQYPDITIDVTEHIGASPVMIELVLQIASAK